MRKCLPIIVLVLLLVLSGGINQALPLDFNFHLKYGISLGNEINTFNNQVTKDLIIAGQITTTIILTNEEKKRIYNQMQSINLSSYPEEFNPASEGLITPAEQYELMVQHNGRIQNIKWVEQLSDVRKANRLREVIDEIISIVESKEEYEVLPPHKGGYK